MEEQEILKDIVFVLLYGGMIMLDVVAAAYLLLRRANAIAPEVSSPARLRYWAAAFMLYSALSHVFWVYYVLHPSFTAYLIVSGLDILILIPTIAGILLSMLQDRYRRLWPVVAALVPSAVVLAICIIRGDEALITPLSIYVIALYAVFMIYMFFAVRRYGRWLRDNYADLEHKEVWQSLLILAVFLLFFAMYSSTVDNNKVLVYLLQIDNIIIVALLLWRVETLQQLAETAPVVEEPTPAPSATQAIPANIGPLLDQFCVQDQLYLQHDLTLAQLAQTIGTNRSYLNLYFAQQGHTYNAYINGLRVDHFIRLYHQATQDKRIFTAQQLAYESGFHSYSTFSSAFKQKTGQTVTAWTRGQLS